MKDITNHSLIRASAGSGKTFALANQFISILVRGESPERLLATTFTKKAAGEIRDRIFVRLANAVQSEEESRELAKFVGGSEFNSEDFKRALKTLTDNQHKLSICTLDSFFSKVAQNFAFEMGLTPGWRLQDPRQQRHEQEREIDVLLEEVEPEVISTLLQFLFRGDSKALIRKQFVRRLGSTYDTYRETTENSWDWFESKGLIPKSELASLVKKAKQLAVPKTKAGKPSKSFEKGMVSMHKLLADNAWRALLDTTLMQKVLLDQETYNRIAIPDEMRAVLQELGKHSLAFCVEEIKKELQSLFQFLRVLDATRERSAKERGVLNFSDVKYYLLQSQSHADLESLYYRLDSKFKHILLDEFQDTSMIEWRLVEPLVDEVLSKDGSEGNSFFCVGDVKQAIYGWRGGVAEIFDTLQSRFSHLKPTENNTSYRCNQTVLNFVNAVFEALPNLGLMAKYQEVGEIWSERYHPHDAAYPDKPGYVAIHSIDEKGHASEQEELDYYEELGKQLGEIIKKYPKSLSVGVLLRGNAGIPEVVYHLRQAGFDASGTQSSGVTDSPAIVFLTYCLKLFEHPTDTNAWELVKRSDFGECFGFSPELSVAELIDKLAALRASYFEHGLEETIFSFYKQMYSKLSLHDVSRMRHLIQECQNIPGLAGLRLREVVAYIEQIDLPEGSDAQVSVMSIHKSKGLEFDVVILPELSKEIVSFNKEYLFAIREEADGPISKVLPRTKEIIRSCRPEFEELYQEYAKKRLAEELSVLYVALTRAKSDMYLILPELGEGKTSSKLTVANLLREALSLGASDSDGLLYEVGAPSFDERSSASKKPQVQTSTIAEFSWKLEEGVELKPTESFKFKTLEQLQALSSGTALHKELETVEWLDTKSSGAKILKGEVRELFQRSRYSEDRVELFREARFGIDIDGEARQLQIDRLVLCFKGDKPVRAEVIDFKSDKVDPLFLQSRVELYRPQMESYRELVARMTGLSTSDIDLSLVFIHSDQVVSLN